MRIFARLFALISLVLLAAACSPSSQDDFSPDAGDSQDPWTLRTSVDDEGRLIAEVTPKGKFRVNTEYPWILTVGEVSQDKRQAAEFSEKKARFVVADSEEADGHLRFSICSNSTCLNPVKDLHWER